MTIIKRVTESPKGLTYEVTVDGLQRWSQWVPWEAGQRARNDAAREQDRQARAAGNDAPSPTDPTTFCRFCGWIGGGHHPQYPTARCRPDPETGP